MYIGFISKGDESQMKKMKISTREFLIQWIFTYGIMFVLAFLQILLTAETFSEMWKIAIDSFVPTTITTTGIIIIQKVRMLNNNFTALFLHLIIIASVALYIAYFAYDGSSYKSYVLRVGLVILMLFGNYLSKRIYSLPNSEENNINHKSERADGRISGK